MPAYRLPSIAFLTFAVAASVWTMFQPPRSALAQQSGVTVFAAASLKNALDDAVGRWRKETGKAVVISYAASSALAKQIEQGAPADIFMSADLDWMEYLDKRKLIRPVTASNLLGNRIVLIARKGSQTRLEIKPGLDLAAALGGGRLALADVNAVPAGKYAKAALESLGAWTSVAGSIAQAENVRAALLLVSRGEAPLGIVYQTDAVADPSLQVIGTFPQGSHPPIVYPIARTANSVHPDAQALLDFLKSAAARPAFEAQGFTLLD